MFEEQPNGATEFATLRELLVGPEQRQLDELAERVEKAVVTPDSLADQLPEAIALRGSRDEQLGRALAPTIETALRQSIRRNPRDIATAIFPVLGPAIRKAIAETMAGLVRSINSAVEHSFSVQGIKWRIESWRTGVPFADVVIAHSLLYRVEQVFLIHADTGLLLAHATAPGLTVPEADLISGMLTAIQDFVRDSFRPDEGGRLSAFTVGEHTVHVEAGPQALIAGVIRGQFPESVSLKLQQTLEQIYLEYATQLTEFEGDAMPFETAVPLLEENLETVLTTDSGTAQKPRAWLRWGIPLLVLLLGGIGWWAYSSLRFSRATAIMKAEPGYVVTDADRSWGRWIFRGLRDPLARDPRTVLTTAGVAAPNTIIGEWKPYLSLDSAMIVARSRETLARATAAMERRIEGTRVLFDPSSSSVTDDEAEDIRALAATLRQLADSAAAMGASVRVDLVGRTDITGTDSTNQSLAEKRVDAVMRRLTALGVPAGMLDGRPLATAQPLAAANTDEQARINRSVSFEASVTNGSRTTRGP